MPLQLGKKVQCGFLEAKEGILTPNLETEKLNIDHLKLQTLEVEEIGSVAHPVHIIHRASTDLFQNDLKFVEEKSRETRAAIRTSGHLAISQDLELYDGTNLETATKNGA